ncbi:Phosphoenolpyruvate carboxykinase family protein [Theileria parva strain Muguga]|uniref:phosphoenolpyruvate carboxykinase (ATP) n=1 Tax=Theileria parva TaxID=5875 RepID=Q4N8H6_THEPA|nr:Phosphoenolpyruvate carboxykinase family protein [Theileria parva strain Muguga]EAN33732.1 Phosphoenolpyruvate carboxykinase family protein [Theileria parva strain Muguga]|eukprot:XP_766015.1 phosphoenolpyruvate carboxykinase [Theileria parva strain Muguga]
MAKVTVKSTLPHHNILLEKVNDLPVTNSNTIAIEHTTTQLLAKPKKFGELDEAKILHNSCIPLLYHHALRFEPHTELTSTGALSCLSGEKTGRSPMDKRTVLDDNTRDKVWWDSVNIPIEPEAFDSVRRRAIDFINSTERIYVTDAFAGWDPDHRVKVRVVSVRAYHAIFMHNLLIVPTQEELANFTPDFTIYNAGPHQADTTIKGITSGTSICINYTSMEMVILGTEYAGEMKKGVLTLMMYLLPQKGLLPLHSSCNVDSEGNVTLFFGLSGTGKTTLSTEPGRQLVGDDEHVWTPEGVFNVEGGCYAKCKDLSAEREPEIFEAVRFGSVLENVVLDSSKVVDYADVSVTENTRCAYPLRHIRNVCLPALVQRHPNNIIFLTCDAFGALPPVSLLNVHQAIYHFVSGYTTKMVGTEIGVTKPTATFSACYAGPFLALSPLTYANLLYEKLTSTGSTNVKGSVRVWLLNTGWIGGSSESDKGMRIPLRYSRRIVDAINRGEISESQDDFELFPYFGFLVPKEVTGVPKEVLRQELSWEDSQEHLDQVKLVAKKFIKNFNQYRAEANDDILKGEPVIDATD